MMKVKAEYTDTFGGEANYSWVQRATLSLPDKTSDREVVRRVKAEFGLTGVRCRSCNTGDMIELRPQGSATIVFITFDY